MIVQVLGAVTPGDGGQGVYWYNASSTAPDNNSTVIVPTGSVGYGAWLQLPVVTPPSNTNVRYVTTGTADTALSSDNLIAWNSGASGPKTEILPAPTTKGQTFTIKDAAGNSASQPITVTSLGGGTFAGNPVIQGPYYALTFVADGVSVWLII